MEALTAALALSLLPDLEHLGASQWHEDLDFDDGCLPTVVLQPLQQLTYLKLAGIGLQYSPGQCDGELNRLQALSRLVDLQLEPTGDCTITANSVSGLSRLTRLVLSCSVEPGAVAGKTRLQHLQLELTQIPGHSIILLGSCATGAAQLLSELQHMQQLTHLQLGGGMPANRCVLLGDHPLAAFAALTASSKLQYLDIRQCYLPKGVWQHMFPAGRHLPHLRELNLEGVEEQYGLRLAAPEGGSCCPNLQSLNMENLFYSNAKQLAPLTRLTGLHTLNFAFAVSEAKCPDVMQCLCELTGLRELVLEGNGAVQADGLLQQLTRLVYNQYSVKEVSAPLASVGCSIIMPAQSTA
jgi:hypothetical protein